MASPSLAPASRLFSAAAPPVSKRVLSRRDWLWALGIALAWRVLVCLACDPNFITDDGKAYMAAAHSLIQAGSLSEMGPPSYVPTVSRGPGYPAFLTLPMMLFGSRLAGIQAVQCVVSLLTIVVVARCVEVVRPERARLALALLALAPFEAFFCAVQLTEVLVTLCIALAVCLPWLWPGRAAWFVSGVCWGLAALTRDIVLAMGVASVLGAVWLLRGEMAQRGVRRRHMALALVGLAVVVAPWTWRNYRLLGEVAPVSKGFLGHLLWIGTWERDGSWADNGVVHYPAYAFSSPQERARVEEVRTMRRVPFLQQDKFFIPLTLQRYRTHPVQAFGSWIVRWPRLWLGTRSDLMAWRPGILPHGSKRWLLFKAFFYALNAVVLLLALAGLVRAIRRRDVFFLWLALPVLWTGLFYLPLHSSEARYSQPVYPFLLCLAALGLEVLRGNWTLWQGSRRKLA